MNEQLPQLSNQEINILRIAGVTQYDELAPVFVSVTGATIKFSVEELHSQQVNIADLKNNYPFYQLEETLTGDGVSKDASYRFRRNASKAD